MGSLWCQRFSRFERFQEAVDHAGGARIALGCYFTPQLQPIAAAGLPALEDVGGVRIKIAGILSSLLATLFFEQQLIGDSCSS